ncbi:MAG: SEL1-like repeat protein [Persicimonas sp.]
MPRLISLLTVLAISSFLAGCSTGDTASPPDRQPSERDRTDQQAPSSAEQAWADSQSAAICADLDPMECYMEGMKREAANRPQHALRHFQQACEDGVMSACYDLGVLYEQGEVVDRDLKRAFELYEKACMAEEPDEVACNNLAVMYQQGEAVEQDTERAAELYRRACEQGSMLGCRNLAKRYVDGRGVEKNPARAGALLEKACQLGHAEACPQLTYLHARGCLDGESCPGDALDPDKAVDPLRRACQEDESPQACLGWGFMVESGYGQDRPDPAGAADHYRMACEEGVLAGCNYLANLYRQGAGVEPDPDQSVDLYTRACDEGFMLSCHTLGVMYLRGRTIDADPPRGYEYIRQACQGGRTESCTGLDFQCYVGDKAACE